MLWIRSALSVLALLVAATPAVAEKGRFEITATTQWINRIGGEDASDLPAGQIESTFESGGGVGFGINYFLSDRWSIEAKGAGLRSGLTVRTRGSDFEYTAELPGANIFPLNVTAQYHFARKGSWQPYALLGFSYVIVQDVEDESLAVLGVQRLEFEEQSGLVAGAGSNFWIADRWAVVADARYVPIETSAQTRYVGTTQVTDFDVRPLIISAGVRYRF